MKTDALIEQPTLLLDADRARANIRRMAEKARRQGVRLRPHFKTHQSAEIGAWFREEGVDRITVSSVSMAEYFAAAGWQDITIAFPANLRERERIRRLSQSVRLGLLAESAETIQALDGALDGEAGLWLKVDVGTGRTGLPWDRPETFRPLLAEARRAKHLRLRGLLVHAGHTYHAAGPDEVVALYRQSVQRMQALRDALQPEADAELLLSAGDTPGCSLSPELGQVEEIRPGNFVFYDVQQMRAGACTVDQIAAAVACPVVALHPERREAVVYGGAVHLSKDTVRLGERTVFGLVAFPGEKGWELPVEGGCVTRVSQEHGIIELPAAAFERVRVGDLLCVLPAHICLVVSNLRRYLTLDGQWIEAMG